MNASKSVDSGIPVIDIRPLTERADRRVKVDVESVAAQIGQACRECGFFYITGHGVDERLQRQLEEVSRRFFAQPVVRKLEIGMSRGGRAWRGYFPVGGELTSGRPDLKEGIYFGAELGDDHPLVKSKTPLHGPNLFPGYPPQFRETVLDYLEAMTQLCHRLMGGIALSLRLEETYFADRYTAEPLTLFRIFNYPAQASTPEAEEVWGVGEHTDYGLLTVLKQDESGGLEIKVGSRWVDAPPIPNSFVCNIGDMLDRMTAGLYRSTPHRVRNRSGRDRLSFPFFFDPNFDAEIRPIERFERAYDDKQERWDRSSVHEFRGTYGDYLLDKVSKVFPELRRDVL